MSVHRVSAPSRVCPVLAKVPKRFGGLGTASDDQGRSFFPREAASPQRMDAPGAAACRWPRSAKPRPVGRPRRHGDKFDLKDPASWPEPTGEHRCESEDYGKVRVRAWSELHPKTRRLGERYGCERAPLVRGTVILVEVGKLPRERPASPRSCGCGGAGRARRISTSSGKPTAVGSTSNTRYAR